MNYVPVTCGQVLDVAWAAKRAVDQSVEADRRCVQLTELTRRATEQANSVRDIAASLTQTASSVARAALDVCRYHSYQQAFEATFGVTHRSPLDLDTFLSLVDNPRQTTGLATETGTCTEVTDERTSCHDTGNAPRHHQTVCCRPPGGNDESTTSTGEVASTVAGECLSSSYFHSASVPAMYVSILLDHSSISAEMCQSPMPLLNDLLKCYGNRMHKMTVHGETYFS